MLTAKQNMLEVIKGGNPDRFCNQFEAVQILFQPSCFPQSKCIPACYIFPLCCTTVPFFTISDKFRDLFRLCNSLLFFRMDIL